MIASAYPQLLTDPAFQAHLQEDAARWAAVEGPNGPGRNFLRSLDEGTWDSLMICLRQFCEQEGIAWGVPSPNRAEIEADYPIGPWTPLVSIIGTVQSSRKRMEFEFLHDVMTELYWCKFARMLITLHRGVLRSNIANWDNYIWKTIQNALKRRLGGIRHGQVGIPDSRELDEWETVVNRSGRVKFLDINALDLDEDVWISIDEQRWEAEEHEARELEREAISLAAAIEALNVQMQTVADDVDLLVIRTIQSLIQDTGEIPTQADVVRATGMDDSRVSNRIQKMREFIETRVRAAPLHQ